MEAYPGDRRYVFVFVSETVESKTEKMTKETIEMTTKETTENMTADTTGK